MSRYNHRRSLERKDYIYRALVSVAVIAVLMALLPRSGYSNYKYHLGEPWDESPIIAQDSFPVYKSDETLKREQDSLRQYYEPYFLWDVTVGEEMTAQLKKDFAALPSGSVPYYYLPHLLEKLNYLYNQGILETDDFDRLEKEKTRIIWAFQQNESNSRSTTQLFTEKTAYEYMMAETDSNRFSHDKLMTCALEKYLHPNMRYDEEKSLQQRHEVDNMLVPFMGQVQMGQKIVDRGQIVDKYTYALLQSLERHQMSRDKSLSEKLIQAAGQGIYIIIMVMLLLGYFLQFRSDYLDSWRTVALVVALYLIFPLMTYGLVSHQLMSVYVIPYCMLPMLIRIFMDSRTAFITHAITILTCAMVLHYPFEFIAIQLVAGLVSIYSLRQLSERSELFRAAIFVTLSTLLTRLCIDMMHGNLTAIDRLDRWAYIYLTIAGILSLLSYLMLIPIERILGFTSAVTLVELSNINNTILRRLSEEAPGTFQHSMQVANLAAEVANKVGGKSQLVRTGALYHDIGKLKNAVFFTENQSGTNPHDNLPYVQSAEVIIQHVADGLEIAEKYKLPPVIKDFIRTHHGTSMAKYFYISYKNDYPDREVDPALFTYPGPNPNTLEQAILMMADSIEAASRSLREYTEESINVMVDKIIDTQVSEGYFNQCPISFLEIGTAKEVFKNKLRTIYHTRIQYPELKGDQ